MLTLLTYYFWFSKSHDIQIHHTTTVKVAIPEKNDKDSTIPNLLIPDSELSWIDLAISLNPNGVAVERPRSASIYLMIIGLLGSIFGSIHCAAWNYAFPSLAEAYLWRISCVLITSIPWLICGMTQVNLSYWVSRKAFPDSAIIGALLIYIVARLVSIIEIFSSLRSAPRGIYDQPDWAPYLGNVGA